MILADVFWLPKSDSNKEEYEDAFGVSESCFAVSDGATESSFARKWARDLVEKFVKSPPEFINGELDFRSWLEPLQRGWADQITWETLDWNVREKARMGASAAFVGIEFIWADYDRKKSGRLWRVIALGDSCLFLIRRDELFAFPLNHTSQFLYSPQLLSSIPENTQDALNQLRICEGWCESGDCFILATDALSSWFLSRYEAGERPWEELTSLQSQDEFTYFINALRDKNTIANDDVTLLIIQIEGHKFFSQQGGIKSDNTEISSPPSEHTSPIQPKEEKHDQVFLARKVPFEDQTLYPSISHRLFGRVLTPLKKMWRKIRPKNGSKSLT